MPVTIKKFNSTFKKYYTIVLEVTVAKSDMGQVIGKRGRNAQAIRTILSAASGKRRENHMFEIVE